MNDWLGGWIDGVMSLFMMSYQASSKAHLGPGLFLGRKSCGILKPVWTAA
jgi:hypothetical protein